MRRVLIMVLFGMVVAAVPAPASQVITRDEIEAAGVTRLSDILLLVDDWAAITTDGYTWRASPNGLSPFQGQCWVVMIDHQVFDAGTFEDINLNGLPISLDQVESVVIESTPTIVAGEFAGEGVIHFLTTPRKSYRLRASVYAMGGNETGDPGPYRYTDRGGSNVDATGPDLALTLGTSRRNWSATFNSSVLVHYFTDPAMRRRTTGILGLDDPGHTRPDDGIQDLFFDDSSAALRQISASLRAGWTRDTHWSQAFVSYSNARRYLHFSDVMGREVPADQRLIHAGIRGSIRSSLSYDTRFSINRLSRHPGAGFDYHWKTRRSRTRVEARLPKSGARIGAGLDHVWADAGEPLEDNTALVVPVYGRMSWSVGITRYDIGGMLSFTNEDKADAFYARGSRSLSGSHVLSATAAYVERLFAENRDIWFWTERGYGLLDSNQVDYSIDGDIGTSRMVTADVEWRWGGGEKTHGAVALLYRRFDDLYLERRDYAFDEATCSFAGPTEVVTGQAGHVAGGRVRVTVPVGPWTEATARYRYQRAVEGDAVFEDVWAAVPDHLASLRLISRPRPDLTAWLSVEWRSATDWADFEGVDGATCVVAGERVTYHSHVDGVVMVDAKLGKRLWGGRASFDILGRNLTGAAVRYHPAGADFDLAFFAQLRVNLR